MSDEHLRGFGLSDRQSSARFGHILNRIGRSSARTALTTTLHSHSRLPLSLRLPLPHYHHSTGLRRGQIRGTCKHRPAGFGILGVQCLLCRLCWTPPRKAQSVRLKVLPSLSTSLDTPRKAQSVRLKDIPSLSTLLDTPPKYQSVHLKVLPSLSTSLDTPRKAQSVRLKVLPSLSTLLDTAPKSSKCTSQSCSFFVDFAGHRPEKLKAYVSKFFLLCRLCWTPGLPIGTLKIYSQCSRTSALYCSVSLPFCKPGTRPNQVQGAGPAQVAEANMQLRWELRRAEDRCAELLQAEANARRLDCEVRAARVDLRFHEGRGLPLNIHTSFF